MPKFITAHTGKLILSGAAALAAAVGAGAIIKPPPLTAVAVLKVGVPAMAPVTVKDITWVKMASPPAGTVTAWAATDVPLSAQAIPAGAVLMTADFTTPEQATGLTPGQARYVVNITPASGVVSLGERVDIWTAAATGTSGALSQELAVGARVIGLYTAQGVPIVPTAASPSSGGGLLGGAASAASLPAMAALAVPASALQPLIADNPGQTVLLVADATHRHFQLTSALPPTAVTVVSSNRPTTKTTAPKS